MKLPESLAPRLAGAQLEALRTFSALLEAGAIPLGLVARSDRGRTWDRHVVDSVRAAAVFEDRDRSAVDIGSGAGLPGIPLAIALPDRRFSLVESRARRVAFLELAVERLALRNVVVHRARVEDIVDRFSVATARAFAGVEASWAAAHGLLGPGGKLVYFAGGGLDPLARARAAVAPEPPVEVRLDPVLETASPLVIMVRG